ncbi:MAG TPA: CoA transferase, partial [Polyangiaceae bacterium]|nr:CoA transferase [Polyangiaceae bacterium]
IGGALWCVVGVLAALRRRDATGQGSVVDVAMVEAVLGFAAYRFGQLFGDSAPGRGGDALGGGLALYGTYATKDGRAMALAAIEPKFWTAFCRGVGIEADMGAYSPGPHQEALKERLRALFASRTRAEWEAFGRAVDCCLEPVLEPGELRDDDHLRARGVFFEIDASGARFRQFKTPLTPQGVAHAPPPGRGEHTRLILREAGIDEETIAALEAEGAARTGA